jgi:hypothetical protein
LARANICACTSHLVLSIPRRETSALNNVLVSCGLTSERYTTACPKSRKRLRDSKSAIACKENPEMGYRN